MGQIYSHAELVVVRLGVASEDSDRAMRYLRNLFATPHIQFVDIDNSPEALERRKEYREQWDKSSQNVPYSPCAIVRIGNGFGSCKISFLPVK